MEYSITYKSFLIEKYGPQHFIIYHPDGPMEGSGKSLKECETYIDQLYQAGLEKQWTKFSVKGRES